jgi:hypothetical protein
MCSSRRRCCNRGRCSCSRAVHWHLCSSSSSRHWCWGGCADGCRHRSSGSQPACCCCCCGCCWFCWCGCSHGVTVHQGLTGQQGQTCRTPVTTPRHECAPLVSLSGLSIPQQQPPQLSREAQPLAGTVWVPFTPQAQPSGPRRASASLQRAGYCRHACMRQQQRQHSRLLSGQQQQQPGKLPEAAVTSTSAGNSSSRGRSACRTVGQSCLSEALQPHKARRQPGGCYRRA